MANKLGLLFGHLTEVLCSGSGAPQTFHLTGQVHGAPLPLTEDAITAWSPSMKSSRWKPQTLSSAF